jgi:hypothetical protein
VLPMVTGSISLAVRNLQDFEFGSGRSNRDSVHVAPKKAAAFLDTRRRPSSSRIPKFDNRLAGQNNCGTIGLSSPQKTRLIEDEDDNEHEDPNFGV